ncbi:hypothetical protein, partial [Pseudomonas aeruginosa]|uniref:hypothetical protein n=1 Tax=Pseudomonas aeruginosa TaxID=287 RepID=UPI001A7E6973
VSDFPYGRSPGGSWRTVSRPHPAGGDRPGFLFLANAPSLRPTRTVLRLYAWLSAELFWSSFTN